MKRVRVVGTRHREFGALTPASLFRVLEETRPEVIFLEVTPDDFRLVYGAQPPRTLEPQAVLPFAKKYGARLIPADAVKATSETKNKAERLFLLLEQNSSEYGHAVYAKIQQLTYEGGFSYLNSETFFKHSQDLNEDEQKCILTMNDPQAEELYEWWKAMNMNREASMVRNILDFCCSSDFENATFLVGAEHLAPLRALFIENQIEGVEVLFGSLS